MVRAGRASAPSGIWDVASRVSASAKLRKKESIEAFLDLSQSTPVPLAGLKSDFKIITIEKTTDKNNLRAVMCIKVIHFHKSFFFSELKIRKRPLLIVKPLIYKPQKFAAGVGVEL